MKKNLGFISFVKFENSVMGEMASSFHLTLGKVLKCIDSEIGFAGRKIVAGAKNECIKTVAEDKKFVWIDPHFFVVVYDADIDGVEDEVRNVILPKMVKHYNITGWVGSYDKKIRA